MHKKVLISILGSALAIVGCDADDDATTGAQTGTATNGADDDDDEEQTTGTPTDSDDTMDADSNDADSMTTDDSEGSETETTDDSEGSETETSDTTETGITSSFITDPDGGGVSIECSIWDQDCGEGEKCAPWANDGGNAWNATRCVPVDPMMNQPGDPCGVEGSGVSGIDTCDVSSMCWDVDAETNEGTCIAFCTGSENAPVCDNPDTSCSIANEGVLILCLPDCDPIGQDCPEGQACYPIDQSFVCAPDASGEMGADNDPCEFINACDPGNICVNPEIVDGCPAGSAGCCQAVCDLSGDPGTQGCTGNETCEPWFEEGAVPPGYEDVGVCALPA